MIRQYLALRCRGDDNPLRVGTIAVGAIYYLQNDDWWRDRFRGSPHCRDPWIVEAFLNGLLGAARRDPKTGHWQSLYVAGRSDIATVRSLRTGRCRRIAVWVLQAHDDQGLYPTCPAYPTLPGPGPSSTISPPGGRHHNGRPRHHTAAAISHAMIRGVIVTRWPRPASRTGQFPNNVGMIAEQFCHQYRDRHLLASAVYLLDS